MSSGLLARAPLFGYIFWCPNSQKYLQGYFFEDFRGPRDGFLNVFQNSRERRMVLLGLFEAVLAASETVATIIF